jgi:protein phosphatase
MDQRMTHGNAIPFTAILPEWVGLTDTGRARRGNEDAFALLPEAGVALLADGMGGHARGELASCLAVSTALRHLLDHATNDAAILARSPGERLVEAFLAANRTILAAAAADPGAAGMGTTLLAILIEGAHLHAAHVGDGRLYRLRAAQLEQLTCDQTVGQLLASRDGRSPTGPRQGPFSNVLTQALGVEPELHPQQFDLDCLPGDLFLLCSDGLHGLVEAEKIRLTLQNFGANLGGAASELIRLANERGGRDNITVVLVRPAIATTAATQVRTV